MKCKTCGQAVPPKKEPICNKCGKSTRKYTSIDKSFYSDLGIIDYTYCGKYGSYPLEDTVNYTFTLCEHCLKELFDNFKVPVKILDSVL